MTIPKIIHYCWFGREPKQPLILECINSWKKYLPDFEVKEWNEDNFTFNDPFIENACELKLWAFVADYARVKVLHDYGGIYLDTDVLFIKALPASFLAYPCFIGAEDCQTLNAAIFGTRKKETFISKLFAFYTSLGAVSNYEELTIPKILTNIVKPSTPIHKVCHLKDIVIFPTEYFYALPFDKQKEPWEKYATQQTIAVHLWAGSWLKQFEENFYTNPELLRQNPWLYNYYKLVQELDELKPSLVRFIIVDGNSFRSDFYEKFKCAPFMENEGQYWGEPENDEAAIDEIKRQKKNGYNSIIFAWPAFWYFEHYKGMRTYLDTNCKCIISTERLVGYDLLKPPLRRDEKVVINTSLNSLEVNNNRFSQIIEKVFPRQTPFFFIQIGANDGVSFDVLFDVVAERQSRGIVVEPVKEYFTLLKENYSYNDNIIPLNLAIHPTEKEVQIYRVDPKYHDSLPEWSSGIASLDPMHHMKIKIPSDSIISETVSAITFMDLVRLHYPFERIDYLQIDTEGFDYEIIKQIDLEVFRPLILKFEYVNLTADAFVNSKEILEKNNYSFFLDSEDVIAYDKSRIVL